MIPETYMPLFQRLYERTEAGEVNWRPTADEAVFAVYLREFSLTMRSGYDADEGTDFVRWELLNTEGEQIDGFYVDSGESNWSLARDLFDSARRKAIRLDDALNAIMNELEGEEPVGLEKGPERLRKPGDELPF